MSNHATGNKYKAPTRDVGALTMRIPKPPNNFTSLPKSAQRAYRYLTQIGRMAHVIALNLDEIDRLNTLVEVRSASYREKLGTYTPNPDQRYDVVARIIDRKAALDAQINELLDAQQEVRQRIEDVKDTTLRTVLELRYLLCKDFDSIAEEVNYSVRRVYTIHIQALEQVQVPADFE